MRARLENAAKRLELLAIHGAPSLHDAVTMEVVAIRAASIQLEGESCNACLGKGKFPNLRVCGMCGGSGEL